MISLPHVAPANNLSAAIGQIRAIIRAEIAMQWRRGGFWLTFGCVAGLLLLLTVQTAIYLKHLPPDSPYVRQHFTSYELDKVMLYGSTEYGVMFFGLIAALLVVDRLERDQRLGITELQCATPQRYGLYVLGKFLGNYTAVFLPTLISYLLCALIAMLLGWPAILLPMFLLAFLLVFAPASLAAVGTTFLLASFLPVRIVQIVISLLWFYLCIGIGWHGLALTIFNTSGIYVYPAFFPVRLTAISGTPQPSLYLALLNIAVLILTAITAILLTYGSLIFQRHRKEGSFDVS
jgi:hypothetical protein